MNGDQHKRVEDLFDQLVDLPATRRDEELVRQCPDDAEVRAEVSRLLGSAEMGSSTADPTFLGSAPKWGIFPDDRQTDALETASIGPYRILEKLGSGGFGTVYKAEQRQPVKRIIALKIIKPGFDTKEVIARFEAERQALARMDHPNIAKVLDAGATAAGRPYFVMEYVAGVSITQFSDDNKLTIEGRLRLFLEVCDAITHAHQKAIIHRDIKSSNVLGFMRDGKPDVKVIDFGIAKALTSDRLTELTLNTAQGTTIGTYESMSPEQAAGSRDVDTRSDVYSLGVLLYHLITGVPPIDRKKLAGMTETEARRTICDVIPPTPTAQLRALGKAASSLAGLRQCEKDSLVRQLNRELEWIPMMAMRKERDRRYASSLQLAEDIQNYLEGRPLIAGPESNVYRLKKTLRRHAGLVSAIASIMIILVLAITGTTVEAIKETQAEKVATAEAATARRERSLATNAEMSAVASAKNANRRLGQAALERAQLHLTEDKDNFSAAMTAAYAIGLVSQPGGATAPNGDPLIDPQSPDGLAAQRLSNVTITPRLVWRSPAGIHHAGPIRSVVFGGDGTLLASGSDDQTARVWDMNQGELLRNFDLHTDAVRSVSLNPNGSRLAAAANNKVRIWDMQSGESVGTWLTHTGTIRCVVYSPRGDLIATASDDRSIRLWDSSAQGNPKAIFTDHQDAVLCVCFSPNEKMLASGSADHTVRLWATTGDRAHKRIDLPNNNVANGVCFSPNGTTLAAALQDGTVCLWDMEGNLIRAMDGKSGPTKSVSFSSDGTLLAAGSTDNLVRVWNAVSGKLLQTSADHTQAVYSVSFKPNSHVLASGSGDCRIGLWDLDAPAPIQQLDGHKDRATCVVFSPSGGTVASASGDNCICLWNSSTGQLLRTLSAAPQTAVEGGSRSVRIAFSHDEKLLASQASDNSTVRLWDLETGTIAWKSEGQSDANNPMNVPACVSFNPDGTILASASEKNAVQLWRVATKKPIRLLTGFTAPAQCLCFSPDGNTVAAGSSDSTIRVWDVQTGKEKPFSPLAGDAGHTRAVRSVSFSRDGLTLASGSVDGKIILWDLATGRPTHSMGGDMIYVNSVCFSPDGTRLASGSDDKSIRLWDAAKGDPIAKITGSADKISSVSFSPDGSLLASASWDGTISVWDVAQDQTRAPLRGHSDSVSSLSFSPTQTNILASASYDRTALLWDVTTGKTIGSPLAQHTDNINALCYSPDGTLLATGSDKKDGTLRLWNTSTGRQANKLDAGGSIICCGFSPDGKKVAAGLRNGTIRIWKTTGESVLTIPNDTGDAKNGTYSICFSKNGDQLVSGSRDGTLRLWNIVSGKTVFTFRRQNGMPAHLDRVDAVCFSPNFKTIASASYDGNICFWDAESAGFIWSTNPHPQDDIPLSAGDGIASLAYSPGGELLAAGFRRRGAIQIWDLTNHKPARTIQTTRGADNGGEFSVSFSRDGKMLAAPSDDSSIGIWNVDPTAQQRQQRVPLQQYLQVYRFDDSLELNLLPAANLYRSKGFLAQSQ